MANSIMVLTTYTALNLGGFEPAIAPLLRSLPQSISWADRTETGGSVVEGDFAVVMIEGLTNAQLTAARSRTDIYIIAEGDDRVAEADRWANTMLDATAKTNLRNGIRSKYPNATAQDLANYIKDADCMTVRDVIIGLRKFAQSKRSEK